MGSTNIWGQRHLSQGLDKRRSGLVWCQEPPHCTAPWLLPALPSTSILTVGAPLWVHGSSHLPSSGGKENVWGRKWSEPETAIRAGRVGKDLRKRVGKAKFWVPRTMRGCSSEHYSLLIPMSYRSGRCDLVSMPEAWALVWTLPQPPPQAKE